MDLVKLIRDVPDFPKPGILFKDITPLLGNAEALDEAVVRLARPYEGKGISKVAGIESRGFIFASMIARQLRAGFVPLRKKGKLPYRTLRKEYALEYGTDVIEMHEDALAKGEKVLMVDDLLATGGTMAAACDLVAGVGAKIVGAAFLVELAFLDGRKKLPGIDIHSVIRFD